MIHLYNRLYDCKQKKHEQRIKTNSLIFLRLKSMLWTPFLCVACLKWKKNMSHGNSKNAKSTMCIRRFFIPLSSSTRLYSRMRKKCDRAIELNILKPLVVERWHCLFFFAYYTFLIPFFLLNSFVQFRTINNIIIVGRFSVYCCRRAFSVWISVDLIQQYFVLLLYCYAVQKSRKVWIGEKWKCR